MTSLRRILTGLAAAALTAAIAITPTTSSDARDAAGHKRPDIGARHGHHRTIRQRGPRAWPAAAQPAPGVTR